MAADLLIVVDVQNGFVNSRSEHVVTPISHFVEKWLADGKPVVATRFLNPEGSKWESLIKWNRLREAPEIDLAAPLQKVLDSAANPESYLVANKLTYSSMTPQVVSFINLSGAQRVAICGIATDGCVLKTAVDVFEAKLLIPIVLTDLVASHAGEEVHQQGLNLISRFIGRDQLVESVDL
jgi:nicotinamidase-related amidase